MSFAVLHIEKGGAGNEGGLGSHIDRTKEVRNADPKLTPKNCTVILDEKGEAFMLSHGKKKKENLKNRINKRIQEGYTGKTKIRKDAVTHLKIVLSGSHEQMKKLEKEGKLKDWFADNYRFIAKEYGQKNIVDFTMHVDERTPHIHAVVVPLTDDGRLSAKKMMGNPEKLTNLQERYGNAMQAFGLERGIKGSKATHDSVTEIPSMKATPPMHIEQVEEPPRIVTNPRKWAERQSEAILSHFKQQIAERDKIVKERAESRLDVAKTNRAKLLEQNQRLKKQNAQLRGIVEEQGKKLNPEKSKKKSFAEQVREMRKENKSQGKKFGPRL